MDSRLKLHDELCEILGSRNAYFQPPESVKIKYPCIVYSLSGIAKRNANSQMYLKNPRYTVIVIDYDPDSNIPNNLLEHFPMCSFVRSYVSDNLNHFVLDLYT